MPDGLVDALIEEGKKGNVVMSASRGSVSFRFGINKVVRNYDDEKDEWLVVRKVAVYPEGVNFYFRWTQGRWGTRDGKHQRLNPAVPSRIKSRRRLEKVIRSMSRGSTAGAIDQYIEVLPWREDGNYPTPEAT